MMIGLTITNMFRDVAQRRDAMISRALEASPIAAGLDEEGDEVVEEMREEPPREMSVAEHMRNLFDRQAELRQRREEMRRDLEAAREAAEAQAEELRNMRIAMEIAARIMRGDNVPQSDKDFLLEQSPGMYKLAMTARNHNNDNPEDHDPLAREDRARNAHEESMEAAVGQMAAAVASSGGSSAPSAPSVSSSGGGGDIAGY